MVGGPLGDTVFYQMDYNEVTKALVAGGKTHDTGFTSLTSNTYFRPIVSLYKGDYFSLVWQKVASNHDNTAVKAIRFNPTGTNIVAYLD